MFMRENKLGFVQVYALNKYACCILLQITMRMAKKILLLFFTLLFLGVNGFSYNYLPIVKSYDKLEYRGGRQNWDIAMDSHGVVYFANGSGLLRNVFGIWQLSYTQNRDMVRSLCIQNDTIWSGGARDFGYFVKNSPGDLTYVRVGEAARGSIWNIVCLNNEVFLQTEELVIIYNKKTKEIYNLTTDDGFYALTLWKNEVWAATRAGELGTISNKTYRPHFKTNVFEGTEVRKLYAYQRGLHILLFDGRIFNFDGAVLKEEVLPKSISGKNFFTSCAYNDHQFCIGTISDGLLLVDDEKNEVITVVNTDNLLIDNTVLSVMPDPNGNLWLGLDYGIAYVEVQSTVKPIFDQGATYFIKDYNQGTYLATNKGLFVSENNDPFTLVSGSDGQVWKLREIENQLYVCHNIGMLRLNGNSVESIYSDDGVMDVAHFQGTNEYLLSCYSGVMHAQLINGKFENLKPLNVRGNPKLLYDATNDCIWSMVLGEFVRQFKLSNGNVVEMKEYPQTLSFFQCSDFIVFYDGERLMQFTNNAFTPLKQAPFNTIKGPGITMFYADENVNNVAFIQNGSPEMLLNLHDGTFYSYMKMLGSVKNNVVEYHEFLDIKDGELRIATDRGVVTFNPKSGIQSKVGLSPVVSKVIATEQDASQQQFIYPYMDGEINLPSGDKDILIHFGISKSVSDMAEFRYRLWPYDTDWSEWSLNTYSKSYTKLKGGTYTFKLECRLNGGVIKDDSLSFVISKYWYQTKWIVLVYIAFFLGCIALTVYIMSMLSERRLQKEQELHGQNVVKETLTIKNEQLLQYAEVIGKKNEFLLEVKEGLSRMRNTDARHWENRILEEVSSEKKNFFFHKLFSELHQDFINRLTEKHPILTPHDVRILSFIRINLDSREIANLMNISPKSVDIHRYRIRKKLELTHETDLNLYIREF